MLGWTKRSKKKHPDDRKALSFEIVDETIVLSPLDQRCFLFFHAAAEETDDEF